MAHVLSLSYGKDSMACLEACKLLDYPIDRVIHAEILATENLSANLPPMVKFKEKARLIIKERYGLEVEHVWAIKDGEKLSYEKQFYTMRFNQKRNKECIYGFPITKGAWCNSKLKMQALTDNVNADDIQYLGIAADEPNRIERHRKPNIVLPLVDIGWDEDYCRKWCEENDLLSPVYDSATRDGCWFCHNQGVDQLRLLYKDYPELWELLLKWDWDSPVTFKTDGRTLHDYDLRFYAEELGLVPTDRKFRWKVLDDPKFFKEI